MLDMSDKVAVVTGGGRGIGAATVEVFREAGANVVCLVRSTPAEEQPGVRYVHADIAIEEEVQAAFEDIDRNEGRIDIVVNNAGVARLGLVGKLSREDWDTVLATNLTGVFLVCSEAMPRITKGERGGAIVNVASTAAFLGMPGRGAYCATKAGLLGLTRAMALEGAGAGITVNSVAPGFTNSEFIETRIADGTLDHESMLERVPLRRIAEPREIAEVIVAVASPAFSFVTGQTILADGGWSIQGISGMPDSLEQVI